ncbi:heavy-metal-associated domain-containing protein [Psychrobacter sp. UBA3962]|uniref:heavy-metal-associated domain-containing protein n=1 Tax=Psychrobacter sp. UBA3962 TaxID=1947352 RepID=UPI0025FF2225|nr:hypothetical protein [Psychrobacter sp. UBA3962]
MAIQQVQFSIKNIDDAEGIQGVITALKNIDGVQAAELSPETDTGIVQFEDTKTSIHAIKAAVSMVDYVTQPFPVDAPANPKN